MNKKNFILSFVTGLAFVNGVFANNTNKDIEFFDVNTVEYIEEEIEIDLGFNTADYLPEGFDPYKIYVDLNAIVYLDEEIELSNITKLLPANFDAYAVPSDVQSISYKEEIETVQLGFDTNRYLPKEFNAYKR